MGSSCRRTRLISVVFPAPDGPETMNKVPSAWKLLDILDLLANPFDLGLQFYNEGAQRRGTRLRSHGVDLAQHLLREEVEFLAGGLIAADRLLHLLDMMREPRQFFGDVAFLDHHHDFLRDPFLGDLDPGARRNLLHALTKRIEELATNLVAMRGEALLQLANGDEP